MTLMASAVLAADGLVRRFGDVTAVNGVSLRIAQGETYGLLGPNGAGKTTTISMICGLLEPDAGTVTVAGERVTTRSTVVKGALGLVPQDIALYPDLSARDNLRFFGKLQGLGGRELSGRIDEVLAIVGLADRAKDRIETYSAVAVAEQAGGRVDPAQVAASAGGVVSPLQMAPTDVSSSFSIIGYFAPAMAMLFLFFTLGAGARSVVTERREGTLQRIRAAPISGDAVLVGKTLGVLVQGLLSIFTVWAVTALAFRVDWGDPLGVAVVLTAVVVSIAGISLLITGLARTENQADALTTVVALALAVVGGSFFFGAAGAVAVLKPYTPNGQAMNALTELSAGEATVVDVLPSVLLLLAIGVLAGALGLGALRRKVVQ